MFDPDAFMQVDAYVADAQHTPVATPGRDSRTRLPDLREPDPDATLKADRFRDSWVGRSDLLDDDARHQTDELPK
jgi:hypothetical protein